MIRFPSPESANDLVSIFGPESQIHIAAQMLLDHVPFEAEFRTPNSAELERLLASHEFVALTERVKRDLNINIVPALARTTASSAVGSASPKGEAIFKLRLNRSNADFLPASKDALEDFLVSRNIDVYETQDRQRSDSFASSFPHFANKLISTVPHAAESTDSFQTDSAARYHQQQVQEHNRLRAAASTPDIKALFDSPSTQQGRFFPSNPTSVSAVATSNNSPLINSSIYTSPYQDCSGSATSLGGDVWGAPKFVTRNSGNSASAGAATSGIAFPPRNARLSDDSKMLQRANEEATMGMEESIKALRKPRSFTHRAQSLDIGALAAQQVIQQAIASSDAGNGNQMNSMRAGMTPVSTSTSFSSNQRPFGAIGSSPNTFGGHHQAGRGGSNDFTNSMAIFAPPTLAQAQHQQHPSLSHHPQHYHHHPHHHHHIPSPSISRLAPSAGHQAPEPETADEVLRSLAQLHLPSSS